MALRHLPRPQDRDIHPPPPPPSLIPHPNGVPPPVANGSSVVSPTVSTSAPNGAHPPPPPPPPPTMIQKLNQANEQTWLLIGRVAEQMGELEHALSAYENALRHNPMSLSGLTQVAGIARIKENYPKAIEFFQRVLSLQEENGEVWSALGHCYLMQDDLQKAYSAYQQALYLLPNPREDPKLWYGIGILYDRYGSLDHAEEAFASVLRMDKDFDKANEILFRLGIIYKQQGKYEDSLACFDRILRNPPSPLAHADIWFQIGHVYEQQKDHVQAKNAYERVVADNPGHAKVLQQLGWLYHQDGSSFQNQDLAIQYLTKSLEADSSDAQSWYLLGRAYMAGQKYNKAYEAYQQAVYRDGRNPTFWCSIGVLYFQINQFRDALDAYSRAIRINPYISEVWFDLGSLYESCNNQISDAIDAYARASELDPGNHVISQRLQLLKQAQATGSQLPAAPGPQDVHPTAYASAVVPPPGLSGPPLLLQPPNQRASGGFRADSRGPPNEISLPPPSSNSSSAPQQPPNRSPPGPFRGGPPPPVIIDENRHAPPHTPLAPMDVDRPLPGPRQHGHSREYSQDRASLLLHHPAHPASAVPTPVDPHPHSESNSYFRNHRSVSPPVPRGRSPPPPFSSTRGPSGPGPMLARSPRQYQGDITPSRADLERDGPWRPPSDRERRERDDRRERDERRGREDRRDSRGEREWSRERSMRREQSAFYPGPPGGGGRSPRAHSPPEPSPRTSNRFWDNPVVQPGRKSPTADVRMEPPVSSRRYDPKNDGHRDYDMRPVDREREQRERDYPDLMRRDSGQMRGPLPPPPFGRNSESPHPDNNNNGNSNSRRKRGAPGPSPASAPASEQKDKEKKKRSSRRGGGFSKSGSPSAGSSSSQSAHTPRPPSRVVDEDYDEGVNVADTLLGLSRGTTHPPTSASTNGNEREAYSPAEPRPRIHRDSVSSTRSHTMSSPHLLPQAVKRALSPTPMDEDVKRPRIEKPSPPTSAVSGPPSATNGNGSAGRRTPVQSTRPSPIPFRTQRIPSRSPEATSPVQGSVPPTPSGVGVLPPHPRPVGLRDGREGGRDRDMALPPIATLNQDDGDDERERGDKRMQIDTSATSPPPRSGGSGGGRHSTSPKGSPGSDKGLKE